MTSSDEDDKKEADMSGSDRQSSPSRDGNGDDSRYIKLKKYF